MVDVKPTAQRCYLAANCYVDCSYGYRFLARLYVGGQEYSGVLFDDRGNEAVRPLCIP